MGGLPRAAAAARAEEEGREEVVEALLPFVSAVWRLFSNNWSAFILHTNSQRHTHA